MYKVNKDSLKDMSIIVFWTGFLTFAIFSVILRLSNFTFSFWVMPFSFLVIGIALFWVRCRYRIIYGLVEIIVCLISISITFLTAPDYNCFLGYFGIDNQQYQISNEYIKMLASFSGLYVIVRGLDNIDQKLKGKCIAWDIFFKGSTLLNEDIQLIKRVKECIAELSIINNGLSEHKQVPKVIFCYLPDAISNFGKTNDKNGSFDFKKWEQTYGYSDLHHIESKLRIYMTDEQKKIIDDLHFWVKMQKVQLK